MRRIRCLFTRCLFTRCAWGLLAALAPIAAAHDLADNRAQLVLRDKTHLTVTFYIAYPDALQLALSPKRSPQEFLVTYSAMRVEDLQKELLRAQAKFQAGTHIYIGPGQELVLTNWVRPQASQVRTLLQQRLMQALVDPKNYGHDTPLEMHAEGIAPREVTSVQVQFPEEFQKVLVVAFRPTQLWTEPKSISPSIKF